MTGVAANAEAAGPGSKRVLTGTHFGGAVVDFHDASITLVRIPNSDLATGRVGLYYQCRGERFTNVVVRLDEAPISDGRFRVTGRTHAPGGFIRVTLEGTFSGDGVTGRILVRRFGRHACRKAWSPFVLRDQRAVAGSPWRPAPSTVLAGLTDQAAGSIRLPVALRVTHDGRKVRALWQALMQCGPRATLPVVNYTPPTPIRKDGSFVRIERYRIRYADGAVDRFRVVLRGQFLGGAAVGTLRASMTTRKPGVRLYPCRSAVQHWSARP